LLAGVSSDSCAARRADGRASKAKTKTDERISRRALFSATLDPIFISL